jgi:hypothetical protein
VHHNFSGDFLHRKNGFGLLNPNPLEFLRYLFPFSSYQQIHFQFFNSAHNSAQFFLVKKVLFGYKKIVEFEPGKLALFCFFPLRDENLAFPVVIIVPVKNSNKNAKWPISYLSKDHFLSKKGPELFP